MEIDELGPLHEDLLHFQVGDLLVTKTRQGNFRKILGILVQMKVRFAMGRRTVRNKINQGVEVSRTALPFHPSVRHTCERDHRG